jgi:hypothetical protein
MDLIVRPYLKLFWIKHSYNLLFIFFLYQTHDIRPNPFKARIHENIFVTFWQCFVLIMLEKGAQSGL